MPADRTRARRATTASSPDATPDATRLLADDHREVHALFEDYRALAESGAGGDERRPLAEEICTLLTVHAALEEEIFYPAARAAGVDAGVLDEAEVEHASAKDLIAQIRDIEADAPLYDAKVRVLGEYIDHHVGEEEDELFPKCRASSMDLADLGARIAARKDELMGEMAEGLDVIG
ncbi:MAG TPA: hemerythrin domain-containing protein [Caldimonas sp.]|nr:hemerythrin domain-containing protein [Caldimonas sp.]